LGDNIVDDDCDVEDLTGAFEVYKRKMEQKEMLDTALKERKFTFYASKNPEISINDFTI
jgi:hypothetical protein